ncbi:MAG: hypothetical protein AB1664_00735 [Thermodesulfobacteriota bacterium]
MSRFAYILAIVSVLALASAVVVIAADDGIVEMFNLSLGLNTTQKPTKLAPGEAVRAHNIDLTKNPGGLTVRDGYDLAITAYGNDSILTNGLFTYNKLGGKRQLMMVADSLGAPYANLYASTDNTAEFVFGLSASPDTFWAVPDVDYNDSVAAARGQGSYHAGLAVYSGSAFSPWERAFDTGTTAAAMVDSIIAHLDSAFGVNITRSGDTAIIAEPNAAAQLSVARWPFPNPFNSGWVGKWTITSTGPVMSRKATRFPAGGGVHWVEHQRNLFVLSGVAPGFVWDGAHAQRFPVKPPGGIDVIPVRIDSTGFGPGRYRYAVKFKGQEVASPESTVVNVMSCLSDEIEVCDSCDVLMSGFPRPARDQFHSTDTTTVEIWRTTAIDNIFETGDTLWYTGANITMYAASWFNSQEYLDTLSDAALRAIDSFMVWGEQGFEAIRLDTLDDDSTRQYTYYHKPGAPVLLSTAASADSFGVWTGVEDSLQIAAGWSWFIVRYDSLLGIYSDSGRSLNIYQSQKPDSFNAATSSATDTVRLAFNRAQAEKFTLVLPRSEDSGIVYLLYRAPIIPIQYDTLTFYRLDTTWTFGQDFDPRTRQWNPNVFTRERKKSTLQGSDFVAFDYRLIGQFAPGDTVSDSLHYNLFLTRTPYQRNRAPSRVVAGYSYDGILCLADEHNLYTSVLYDTVLLFSALNQRPIGNASDGEITAIWPERGYVKVATTKALFNVSQIETDLFGVVEVAGNYGNVSPYSAIRAPEGTYILSDDEARLLGEGVFRDRSITERPIAGQLDNFSQLSPLAKSKAFAAYVDNKLLLSIGDTTYVANKVRGRDGYHFGWTTWGLSISAAALYRGGSDLSDISDTLYFSKPGGIEVYRLTGATTDSETDGTTIPIDWQWRSGALPGMSLMRWQPSELIANLYSTDSTSANLTIDFYDARDSLQSAAQITFGRIDTANVYRYELGAVAESPYWYLDLHTDNPIGKTPPPNAETTVEGLVLKLIRRGDI